MEALKGVMDVGLPPVDPGDILAAKEDPRRQFAEMQTLNLIATLCGAGLQGQVKDQAEQEFHERLLRASTPELLTWEWRTNSNKWTRKKISQEYVSRIDARPEGVVLLYKAMEPDESSMHWNEREEFLGKLFVNKEGPQGTMVRVNQVVHLLTASHFAEMHMVETNKRTRQLLAARYADSPGAEFGFLAAALKERSNWEIAWTRQSVVEGIRRSLTKISNETLRESVADFLGNTDLLGMLLGECKRRTGIRPEQYLSWVDKVKEGDREKLDFFRTCLMVCYSRLPLQKLVGMVKPWKYQERNSQTIKREAILNVLANRIEEADREMLEAIYQVAPKARDQIAILYANLGGEDGQSRKQQLLAWAADEQSTRELTDLCAFLAIGLGATAKEIESLYFKEEKPIPHNVPEARAFTAYASLPNSKKDFLLSWARNPILLRKVKMTLMFRTEISAADFEKLIDLEGSRDTNQDIFELYCSRADADPKKMIDWYGKASFARSDFLAKVLRAKEPKPKDVIRLLNYAEKSSYIGPIKEFAIWYFSRHVEAISVLLEEHTEGKIHDVLVEAYKQSEQYQQQVAKMAAENQ
jgi:hypothetical protein